MLKLDPQNKRFYAWNCPRLHIRLLSSKKTLSTFVLLYFPLGFIRVKWDAVMCCSTEIQLIMRFLLPIMLLSYKFYSVCVKFLNVSFVMPRICARNEIYYEAILKIRMEFTFNYIYIHICHILLKTNKISWFEIGQCHIFYGCVQSHKHAISLSYVFASEKIR
jgi:hypothetical protein